jgi:hypothetical protein
MNIVPERFTHPAVADERQRQEPEGTGAQKSIEGIDWRA